MRRNDFIIMVVKGDYQVVLVDDISRNLSLDYFIEDCDFFFTCGLRSQNFIVFVNHDIIFIIQDSRIKINVLT